MLPEVYPLLAGNTEVAGFVGSRIYRHGRAPQNVHRPYITWSVASMAPENTLSEMPIVDHFSVQVDCWSDNDQQVEDLARAVRDAIEPHAVMTGMPENSTDPQTLR